MLGRKERGALLLVSFIFGFILLYICGFIQFFSTFKINCPLLYVHSKVIRSQVRSSSSDDNFDKFLHDVRRRRKRKKNIKHSNSSLSFLPHSPITGNIDPLLEFITP